MLASNSLASKHFCSTDECPVVKRTMRTSYKSNQSTFSTVSYKVKYLESRRNIRGLEVESILGRMDTDFVCFLEALG